MRQSYHSDYHNNPSTSSLRQSQSVQYRPPMMRQSTSSLQPVKNIQFQHMANTTAHQRIQRFCAQQKLLAQKDFRIQELIQDKINYRSQGRYRVQYLQDQINRLAQLKKNNQSQIQTLRKVNEKLQNQFHNRNIMLTQLLTKSEQQHKFNDNVSKQLQNISNLIRENQNIQQKQSNRQQNGREHEKQFQNGLQFEKVHEQIRQQLKRVEQQLNFAYNKIAQLLNINHPIDDYLFDQSHSSQPTPQHQHQQKWQLLISQIKSLINSHSQQIQNNQTLLQHVATISQTLQHEIQKNNKLTQQNNILNQNLKAKLQQFKSMQEQIMHLHSELEFVVKEKEKKEVQVFALKYNIEQEKNQLTNQIKKINENDKYIQNMENVDQNGDEKRQNQYKKADKDYTMRKLNKKLMKYESILQKKDMHIRILQQNLDSQRERSKRVMVMATQFDKWFQALNEQNYLSKSSFNISTVKSTSKETSSFQNNSSANQYDA